MSNARKSKDMLRREQARKKQREDMQYKVKLLACIRKFDDPILMEVCDPFEAADDRSFFGKMEKVLLATHDGVGISAPQIGVKKRVIAFRNDVKSQSVNILVNPEIVGALEDTIKVNEGCLSYPGVFVAVDRLAKISVKFETASGSPKTEWFTGMDAVIIQHEIDHIQGKCAVGDRWREMQQSA